MNHAFYPIRIMLLDHHQMVREGLRLLLQQEPGLEVVGEAGERQVALELLPSLCPDLILLELNLDGELDIEFIPQLLHKAGEARLILVTAISDPAIHRFAVQAGAMGVVEKKHPSSVLIKAIHKVHAGEVWIDRMMMAEVLTDLRRIRQGEAADPEAAKIAQLSEREREVIRLVGEGLRNKEIAQRLSISEVTVRHHLTSIYNKLGVSDRLELTIYAYQNGLAELPA